MKLVLHDQNRYGSAIAAFSTSSVESLCQALPGVGKILFPGYPASHSCNAITVMLASINGALPRWEANSENYSKSAIHAARELRAIMVEQIANRRGIFVE